MRFKPFVWSTTDSIPTWIIIVSAIVFFPLAVALIVLRLKACSKNNIFAGRLLFGTGIFCLFSAFVIAAQWLSGSLKTTAGAAYPLGSFLLIVAVLLILARLYLSIGYQLLQHIKPQTTLIIPEPSVPSTDNLTVSCAQPIICPSCGASNQIKVSYNDECEYCGTPLHS